MRIEIKELGKTAEVSSSESESSKELAKLLFLATLSILILYFSVSFASEYFIRNISVEQENKWFNHFDLSDIILSDTALSPIDLQLSDPDSAQITQVEKILIQLRKHPSIAKLDYKIFIIEDDDINAFAFPGGSIGVTSGLLEALKEEEKTESHALAFVIGHELGHFKYRHHLKGLSRTISIGLVFTLLTGNSGDLSLVNNVLTLLELNHSQKQETESDLFSAKLVFDTYGSTKNIEKLFIILKEEQKEQNSFSFLNTHPSSDSRIERLLQFSESLSE